MVQHCRIPNHGTRQAEYCEEYEKGLYASLDEACPPFPPSFVFMPAPVYTLHANHSVQVEQATLTEDEKATFASPSPSPVP